MDQFINKLGESPSTAFSNDVPQTNAKWLAPHPREKPKQRGVEEDSRLYTSSGVPYPTLESGRSLLIPVVPTAWCWGGQCCSRQLKGKPGIQVEAAARDLPAESPEAGWGCWPGIRSPNLVLLPLQRTNERQDVGVKRATFFGKPANQEYGGLLSQRTISPPHRIRVFLC